MQLLRLLSYTLMDYQHNGILVFAVILSTCYHITISGQIGLTKTEYLHICR